MLRGRCELEEAARGGARCWEGSERAEVVSFGRRLCRVTVSTRLHQPKNRIRTTEMRTKNHALQPVFGGATGVGERRGEGAVSAKGSYREERRSPRTRTSLTVRRFLPVRFAVDLLGMVDAGEGFGLVLIGVSASQW